MSDAINELLSRDPPPGIGHNRAPTLGEEIAEETKEIAARAHEMVICADERAEIYDDDTAAKGVQLLGQMKDLIDELENMRVARKEPFLRSGRVVDGHYNAILAPLAGPDHKKKLGGSAGDLLARIDQWRRHKDAEAEQEKERLFEAAQAAQTQANSAQTEERRQK